jgi:hypothetical protein
MVGVEDDVVHAITEHLHTVVHMALSGRGGETESKEKTRQSKEEDNNRLSSLDASMEARD